MKAPDGWIALVVIIVGFVCMGIVAHQRNAALERGAALCARALAAASASDSLALARRPYLCTIGGPR